MRRENLGASVGGTAVRAAARVAGGSGGISTMAPRDTAARAAPVSRALDAVADGSAASTVGRTRETRVGAAGRAVRRREQ